MPPILRDQLCPVVAGEPSTWLAEGSRLRARPYHTVSYCKYSAAKEPCCPAERTCAVCEYRRWYQKNTAIWTNTTWVPEIEPCGAGCRCPYFVNGKHPEQIGAGLAGGKAYPVPGRLTREIFTYLRDQAS